MSRLAILGVLSLSLASGCVRIHPRADLLPRRDGSLSVDAAVAAPADAKNVVLWIPVPRDEPAQVLRRVAPSLPAGATSSIVNDLAHGNPALRIEFPAGGPFEARALYEITRGEDRPGARLPSAPNEPVYDGKEWLHDEGLAIADERVKAIAADLFQGAPDNDAKARKAFDYVLANMRYAKDGTGWGTGSTAWACDAKYGNCTDFHALFLALVRSGGVPGRFRIGFSLPEKGGAPAVSGYHCWAEYWSPKRGWTPVDASEAWKHAQKRDYLFGHLDPDRVGLSLGRDLKFAGQQGQPLNYFVFPYAEADGTPVKVETKVAWTDRGVPAAQQ